MTDYKALQGKYGVDYLKAEQNTAKIYGIRGNISVRFL